MVKDYFFLLSLNMVRKKRFHSPPEVFALSGFLCGLRFLWLDWLLFLFLFEWATHSRQHPPSLWVCVHVGLVWMCAIIFLEMRRKKEAYRSHDVYIFWHPLVCIFTQPHLLTFLTPSAIGVPPSCADIIWTCPLILVSKMRFCFASRLVPSCHHGLDVGAYRPPKRDHLARSRRQMVEIWRRDHSIFHWISLKFNLSIYLLYCMYSSIVIDKGNCREMG